ncbi:MAG: sugar phosphate isomerase/epimerase family protein [bacterium]|nr:sugar phosphate isomerase/epimerase family protein [bacterium]
MRFGICTGLENLELVEKLGFDYIEPQVSKIAEYTQEEFDSWKEKLAQAKISCETFNVLFPGTIHCIGEEYDEDTLVEYLNRALARVEELGGEIVVFGSGKQRSCPDYVPFEEGVRQLVYVYRLVGEIAAKYHLTVVIEPLNRTETNMICTMAEGAMLAGMVDLPNVKLLADYYHVAKDNDPISDISRIGNLAHTHIATKEGRRYPLQKEGDQFDEFFKQLKGIGYEGRVSIEGGTDCMEEDAKKALAFLRELDKECQEMA